MLMVETKNLILRNPHLTDTRANVITLTPEGKTLFSRAMVIVEQTDRQFFAKIGAEQKK